MRKTPQVLMDVRGRLGAYHRPLSEQAQDLLARLGRDAGLDGRYEISLLLTDNPTMHRLNRLWRQVDRATDVLSFPIHRLKPGQAPPAGTIGDIVISLPYLRQAAKEEGVCELEHLARLLIHGLLHLLGYDHESDKDARKMEREERRLLELERPPAAKRSAHPPRP